MTPKELALFIAKSLDDKKAQRIEILEIAEITTIADYFIICTGSSTTHIKSLADEVEMSLKAKGMKLLGSEGYMGGGWILLDFASVVVHVFLKDTREFYSLEHLWGDARRLEVDFS